MAIRNTDIILAETIRLINEGIISETDCIHTYERWRELGYQVQKGEKAITRLTIWKPIKSKKDEDRTKLIWKESAFFSSQQVKPIVA